jgi:hypothetical protein
MVVPNYTNLELKMPDSKGVITVEGNFEQTYYSEHDYIAQATALVTPRALGGLGRDAGRAPTEGVAKAVSAIKP